MMIPYIPPLLPPANPTLETTAILKQAATAHRYLAELKGLSQSIPDQSILINTLALQEAKDSSEIENIITTHDDLYKADLFSHLSHNPAAKEVSRYAAALKLGHQHVLQTDLLTANHIIDIHKELEANSAGFRVLPGTALKNDKTGEVIYTPPQHHDDIIRLMGNLEAFINDDSLTEWDILVKMAIIHFQFETIHPFYDGNGRTGRIINILYLVQKKLLDIPILYLSRYITKTKAEYYRLLQHTRVTGDWEAWILYMLRGVEVTARETIILVQHIKTMMQDYKQRLRQELPKIYSHDLLSSLFKHPYTKIEYAQKELKVSRLTAVRYLNLLTDHGFLEKHKLWRQNYYVNMPLFTLLMTIPEQALD